MIVFEELQEATRQELHDCWQCLEKLKDEKDREEEHRERGEGEKEKDKVRKTDGGQESNTQFTAAILVGLIFFVLFFFKSFLIPLFQFLLVTSFHTKLAFVQR